jgi:pyridoxal phosphate enzyme (YggS family)
VAEVRGRIEAASRRAGRRPQDVTLLGASKSVPVSMLQVARAAGVLHFGENRAADLAAKAEALGATWHFIGKLQRGTARKVADVADVIHSAERGPALERVARRAASSGRRIDCLIQVDFTGRRQGVAPGEVADFASEVAGLDGLRLVGLMTLPPLTSDPEGARPYFRTLRSLLNELQTDHPEVRELSMGMSADFEIGVEEGATMVRVGSALFGPRPEPGTESASGQRQRG